MYERVLRSTAEHLASKFIAEMTTKLQHRNFDDTFAARVRREIEQATREAVLQIENPGVIAGKCLRLITNPDVRTDTEIASAEAAAARLLARTVEERVRAALQSSGTRV